MGFKVFNKISILFASFSWNELFKPCSQDLCYCLGLSTVYELVCHSGTVPPAQCWTERACVEPMIAFHENLSHLCVCMMASALPGQINSIVPLPPLPPPSPVLLPLSLPLSLLPLSLCVYAPYVDQASLQLATILPPHIPSTGIIGTLTPMLD